MPIVFACFSPHPPIILPNVGSPEDRAQVEKTIESLEKLGEKLKKSEPDLIIISAPHANWGIEVPLHFLVSNLKNEKSKLQFKIKNYQNPANVKIEPLDDFTIYPILTTSDSPQQHYEWGQKFYKLKIENCKLKIALIASGDLSHVLKGDGPYGHHPDGPKFDISLIDFLKRKEIKNILKLDEMYPEAAECGLRSFCFLLGAMEASGQVWQPEILSYEGPFGVGYLVANFRL